MPRRLCLCVLCALTAACLLLLLLQGSPALAQQPPAGKISFIRDVAPVLKENCFACHDSRKKSGKYDMTTFEKMMAGGVNGEQIVAGKPDESEFHYLIVTTDERRMPPRDKGEAVPQDKAKLIAQWIREGAQLDAGIAPTADLVKELRLRWVPPHPPKVYKYPAIVNALAFAPDGKTLVVSGHHELTFWELPSGRLVKRLRTRAERAYALAFLADGKLAVAGGRPGQEGDLRIYDVTAQGKTTDGVVWLDGVTDKKVMIAQLHDAEDSVLCLAVSPGGKKLAAGGCDRTVRVWDLSEGLAKAKITQTIENHADWVLGLAFSPDGKLLASAARDKTAKVWDIAAKESLMTFPEHQNIVYGVGFNEDASLGFSVGADKLLRSWKPNGEGKQVRSAGGHGDEVFKIAVGPGGKLLATASADKSVRLWNAEKLTAIRTLEGHDDFVYALAFSPDGEHLAAGAYDGGVHIWNVKDGKTIAQFNASPGYKLPPSKK